MYEGENAEKTGPPTPEQVMEAVSSIQTLSELEDAVDVLRRIQIEGDAEKEIVPADVVIDKIYEVMRGQKSVKILTKFGLEEKVSELLAKTTHDSDSLVASTQIMESDDQYGDISIENEPKIMLTDVLKRSEKELETLLLDGFGWVQRVMQEREDQGFAPLVADGFGYRLRQISQLLESGWRDNDTQEIVRSIRNLTNSLSESGSSRRETREDLESVQSAMRSVTNLGRCLADLESRFKTFRTVPGIEDVMYELSAAQRACEDCYGQIAAYYRRVEDYLR